MLLSPAVTDDQRNVLLNLIASAIYSVLAALGKGASRAAQGSASPPDLQTLIRAAVLQAVERVEWSGPLRIEELCLMLETPEMEANLRALFSSALVMHLDPSEESPLPRVRKELRHLLVRAVGPHERISDGQCEQVLRFLLDACDTVLAQAVHANQLFAHEALAAVRHRLLRADLAALRQRLESPSPVPSLATVHDFARSLREQIHRRHSHLSTPSVDGARRIPIEQMYVDPDMLCGDATAQRLGIAQFLDVAFRAVLLGQPGGGKTTFTEKLCHDLTGSTAARTVCGRRPIPLLVILRDYAIARQHGASLIDYLYRRAKTHYQLPGVPAGAIEHLLAYGEAMLLFDGLDELIEPQFRQDIRSDVETFCQLFPAAPALVTAREVGYDQAPLDNSIFSVHKLAPFSDSQVTAYVHNWFASQPEVSERQRQVQGFVRESDACSDLRQNALLLSLLCTLYRGEGYLPQNRPDIYRRCSELLFERWDRQRGVEVSVPFVEHMRPALAYLASWIYGEQELQAGVPERRLVVKTAEYLKGRRFSEADAAEGAAEQFIGFCRGRAWIFTDTGTTARGEPLYQFTHRTFLEYFAAEYLIRTTRTVDDLLNVLVPRIAVGQWQVVAELATQLYARKVEDGADEIILALLDRAVRTPTLVEQHAREIAYFCARALSYLVLMPSTIAQVVPRAIDASITECQKDRYTSQRGAQSREHYRNALLSLVSVSRENAQETQVSLNTHFEARLSIDAEISTVDVLISIIEIAESHDVRLKPHFKFTENAFTSLLSIVSSEFHLAVRGLFYLPMELSSIVDKFGLSILLASRSSGYNKCLLQELISRILLDNQSINANDYYNQICNKVRSHKIPWLNANELRQAMVSFAFSVQFSPLLRISSREGAMCVFYRFIYEALREELFPGVTLGFVTLGLFQPDHDSIFGPKESRYDFVVTVLAAMRAVGQGKTLNETSVWIEAYAQTGQLEHLLDPIPLEPWQRDLMLNWSRGLVNLVDCPPKTEGLNTAELE